MALENIKPERQELIRDSEATLEDSGSFVDAVDEVGSEVRDVLDGFDTYAFPDQNIDNQREELLSGVEDLTLRTTRKIADAKEGPLVVDGDKILIDPDSAMGRRSFIKAFSFGAIGFIAGSEPTSALTFQDRKNDEEKIKIDPEVIRSFMEKWQKIKEVLNDTEIPELLSKIKEKVGDKDVLVQNVDYDINLFNRLKSVEDNGQDFFDRSESRRLLIDAVNAYERNWDKNSINNTIEKNNSEVVFEGFDQIPDVDVDDIKSRISKRYNKKWVNGAVDKIIYIDEEQKKVIKGSQGDRVVNTVGMVQDSFFVNSRSKEGRNITLYKGGSDIYSTINHEMAHLNDWDYAPGLSYKERLEFYLDVVNRVREDTRKKYDYVETMIKDGASADKDEKAIDSVRVREYWAEICKDFFTDPRTLIDTPPDIKLVQKWYSKITGN